MYCPKCRAEFREGFIFCESCGENLVNELPLVTQPANTNSVVQRSKYWWLYPTFSNEKDARDGAKMGVVASGLIAIVTGVLFWYLYTTDGDIFGLVGGLIVSLIWCILSYGIFKMSRVASSVALLFFLADKVYTVRIQGKSLGIASILVLYLINANRAIYWFKRNIDVKEAEAISTSA